MHNEDTPSSASAARPQPPKSSSTPPSSQPRSLPAADVLAARPAPLHPTQTSLEWPESQRRMSYPGPSTTTTTAAPSTVERPRRPLSMHGGPSQRRDPFRLPQMQPQPPQPPRPQPVDLPTYHPPWPAEQGRALPPVSELVREGMQFSQDEPRLIAPTVPGAHRMWYGAVGYEAPPPSGAETQQQPQQQQQQQVERQEPQRLFPLFRGPPPQTIAPMPPLPITRAPPTPPSHPPQEPMLPPRPLIFPQRRGQGRQGVTIPRGEGGVRKRVLQHACHLCSYRAHQSSDLKRHLATHQNLRPFRCPSCELRFRQKAHLNAHQLAIHSKLKPHKCDVCKRTFAARSSLKRHVTYVHNRNPPYICPNCPAQFQRVFDRNRHQAAVHGDAAPPTPGGPSQMQLQQQQQQALQIQHQQQIQQQAMRQTDPRFAFEAHPQQHARHHPRQQQQPQQQVQRPSQVQRLQQLHLPQQFMQLQLRPPEQPRASSGMPPSTSPQRDPLPPPPPAPPPPPRPEGSNG